MENVSQKSMSKEILFLVYFDDSLTPKLGTPIIKSKAHTKQEEKSCAALVQLLELKKKNIKA